MFWFYAALILIGAFGLFWIYRFWRDGKFIVKRFQRANCIVCGHKGNGKDLLFMYVINKRRKKHYSNIKYNSQTTVMEPREFNIDPNTYKNFLNGTVEEIPKTLKEGMDYYLSDGGIFMPSTYQDQLVRLYPSLPLAYAIQRHLYNSNFHVNVQNIQRLWDKIREQADYYFTCVAVIKLGKRTFIQKIRYYEQYEAAKANVLPFEVNRILGIFPDKDQLAREHEFRAQNGNVKYLWIFNRLPKEHYDTRHFHKVLFGKPALERKKAKKGTSRRKK